MADQHEPEIEQTVRVGFRYRDGEVLSPEREAESEDVELPEAVIDLGDGDWLTLAELRDLHAERLEQALGAWEEPHYVDCTCGHPNADHVGGACPFPGCGCGVLDDSEDLSTPGQPTQDGTP